MAPENLELAPPTISIDDILVLHPSAFGSNDETEESVVAVVTGAASGIGRATAIALAANGLRVVGADVDTEGLAETEAMAEDLGTAGTIVPSTVDLTEESAVETMIETAAQEGSLRYVANIAGIQHIASIPEFPVETFDRMLAVMLRAPYLTAKFAIPRIREALSDIPAGDRIGAGAIANMSSVHGHYATTDKVAYLAAKHGLNGITRAIAAEGNGIIRSFSISVGYVLTPLMADQIADTAAERGISEQEVVESVMLGQARTKAMMRPIEVANLFVFGVSRHGRHLNGGDMRWDGGFTTTYQ